MKTKYSDYKSPPYKTRAVTSNKNKNQVVLPAGNIPHNPSVTRKAAETAKAQTTNNEHTLNTEKNNEHTLNTEKELMATVAVQPQPTTNLFACSLAGDVESNIPIFLNEPYKIENLYLSEESIQLLNGNNWLSTELIDFLIKHGTPFFITSDIAIPSTDIERILEVYNKKAKSTEPNDLLFIKKKREELKYFGTKPIRIYSVVQNKGHFFVIDMIFDATDSEGDFFQSITVYDNLLRRERINENSKKPKKKLRNDSAIKLLKKYQTFFYNYILYDKSEDILLNYKNAIYEDICYVECPLVENKYDSGLYAYVIFLHIVRGIFIQSKLFTQSDITTFRKALYIVLTGSEEELKADPKKFISTDFITSFFGMTFQSNNKPNNFINYFHKATNYVSPSKRRELIDEGNNLQERNIFCTEVIGNQDDNENQEDYENFEEEDHHFSDKLLVRNQKLNHVNPERDVLFKEMFVYGNDIEGNYKGFDDIRDMDDLSIKITQYEREADIKLRIEKSSNVIGSRLYTCVSHNNCMFRARFGPRRGDKKIILKNTAVLFHCGIDRDGQYENGKLFKQQLDGKVGDTIETIESIKYSKVVAKDIVKATKSVKKNVLTYNQGHQVLSKSEKLKKIETKKNYEKIIPYLQEFKLKNPGTVTDYEIDNNSCITKLFICPGIMNNKLLYVRPMLALDAAHLNDDSKGTLYLAVIKSGNDEILPVAIAFTEENENINGWNFFLKNFKKACPNLIEDHRLPRCRLYKYWSFVSDRDKGLLPALKKIFPDNHHSNCLFHIQQNVVTQFGKKCGEYTFSLGKTFSITEEEELFEKIRKCSVKAEQYLLRIDAETWRSTEWVRNDNLPPRYGMVTSNICESANFMFKNERNLNWLKALDGMFHKIMFKIAKHRQTYSEKKGMIKKYEDSYKTLFNNSISYNILPINEQMYTYKVYMGEGDDYDPNKTQEINMRLRKCSCGTWQDTELMCVHAITYYRVIEKKSLKQIMDLPFNHYYSYKYLRSLYKDNINPVILDSLSSDKTTKPPPFTKKRKAGRPPTKRKSRKPQYEKTVTCSNCGGKAHNKTKCTKEKGYKILKELGLLSDSESEAHPVAVVPGVSTSISTNKDRISSSDEKGNTSDEGSIEEEENSSYDGINGYDEEDRKPKAKRYKK